MDINEELPPPPPAAASLDHHSRPHVGVPSRLEVKSLPAIARYQEREPVYRPTSSYERPSECPYIPRRPAHECYNAPPSECAEAGHGDVRACPRGTLCCYDGCINLCWSPTVAPGGGGGAPLPPPLLPPFAPPPSQQRPGSQETTVPVGGGGGAAPASAVDPSGGSLKLAEEPLFYHPAPRDFQPSVGPPPLVEGPLLSPADIVSDYHVETNPLLAPGPPTPPPPPAALPFPSSFLPSTTQPPTPTAAHGGPHLLPTSKIVIPPSGAYEPPSPGRDQYSPPLENRDALPVAPTPRHPDGKALGRGQYKSGTLCICF